MSKYRSGFTPRGPLSKMIDNLLALPPDRRDSRESLIKLAVEVIDGSEDIVSDDDLQASLTMLYGLCYGDLGSADPRWEWDPRLIEIRGLLENSFEQELRTRLSPPLPQSNDVASVAAALFELTAADDSPSVSKFIAREATLEQAIEFLIQKSIYTLKEADPHSWAIPRLQGRAKAALVEIQADEYGGGRFERVHSRIFAQTLESLGLSSNYGDYLDHVPAVTLASFNAMSMFGLNRRLRGAIVGHLAAFEMTSSIPNKFYGNGFRRLGFDERTTWYFDEHVAADAVHEQIAARDLAGSLAEDQPQLVNDIFFGAAACLYLDGLVGAQQLDAWREGRSSLRQPVSVRTIAGVS